MWDALADAGAMDAKMFLAGRKVGTSLRTDVS